MSHAPAARLSLDYFDFGRIISLDFLKSADKHLPQNRPLTGSEPKPASPALGARWIFFMMRIVNYSTSRTRRTENPKRRLL